MSIIMMKGGGLKSITTPKGSKHAFRLEVSLGFYKLIYSPPSNSAPNSYTIYLDAEHRPIMKMFPKDSGKLLYVYNNRTQLKEVVFGGGKVENMFNKISGLLTKEVWRYEDQEFVLNYEYNGALLVKQSHQFVSSYLLSNLVFGFHYDSFGRMKVLSARVGAVSLPTVDYSYNSRTGRLEGIANFRLFDKSPNETYLTDGVAVYSKTFDGLPLFASDITSDRRQRGVPNGPHLQSKRSSSPVQDIYASFGRQ